jgi:hypothetical protein
MEKVKVDTEIRKLDQLRAAHINQQHNIRWQVKSLPEQIERARKYHAAVSADILTRDAHADEDFTMKVGNRVLRQGRARGSRERPQRVVMSWRDDKTLQVRGHFKGLRDPEPGQCLQRWRARPVHPGQGDVQGQSQPDNPLGTIQSIEHDAIILENGYDTICSKPFTRS